MSPGIRTMADKSDECRFDDPTLCIDAGCLGYEHLPEPGDDTVWTEADEDRSWLWDDDRARRRADV